MNADEFYRAVLDTWPRLKPRRDALVSKLSQFGLESREMRELRALKCMADVVVELLFREAERGDDRDAQD